MSALSPQILFVNLLFYIFCSSMPLGKERIESDSEVSDRNALKPPSPKEFKSVPSALKMCLVFCVKDRMYLSI